MKDVTTIEHPLVQHYLSILKDKTTGKTNFKYSLEKTSYLFASYVYSSLELKNISKFIKNYDLLSNADK